MSAGTGPHVIETVADGIVFPESPRWDGRRLWWSDMHGHQVMTLVPGGAPAVVAEVDKPSGIGFLPDGTPLVTSMRRKVVLRLDGAAVSVHADLGHFPGEFLNDMVVDGEGMAYVGCRTHRRPGLPPSEDVVVLVRPDGSSEIAASGIVGPNGTVLSPDGSTLVIAETQAQRITAFQRRGDGRLTGRRVFAALPAKTFPDGMALDAEGAVWVGTGFGQTYLRVRQGGEVVERLCLPDRWAVACTLGGPGRRTLYLATAATTLASLKAMNDADASDPDAYRRWARTQSEGRIESVAVAVAGAGLP